MNISSMLARLEDALGQTELAKAMVLLPQHLPSEYAEITNLVVGYNGSPCSQTALDLTLWIAHQTRLATRKQVTVQVVYVVDSTDDWTPNRLSSRFGIQPTSRVNCSQAEAINRRNRSYAHLGQRSNQAVAERGNAVERGVLVESYADRLTHQMDQFEQADRILWQARHLADEWRGSLKTHLRFGSVASELRDVVEAETAALLLLGCTTPKNAIVRQLGTPFPCPVLGIPPASDGLA